jgi:hypothetical protein
MQRTHAKQTSVGPTAGDSAPPPAVRCRAANAEGIISPSFSRKRESSKKISFTGFPLPRERRKGFLKQLLMGCLMEAPPALPCGSDACRENALQRDTCAGPSQKGSLRNPSRLAPLPQTSALQRTHAKQTSVGATEGDSALPPAVRCRAANGVHFGAGS